MSTKLQRPIGAYYDRDSVKQVGGVELNAERLSKIRATSWMLGESEEQYLARLKAAARPAFTYKTYLDNEYVLRDTMRALNNNANQAYGQIFQAVPKPVQTLMSPCHGSRTLQHMPHLGYADMFQMVALYGNGQRSRIKFFMANFTAAVYPTKLGLEFKDIPHQYDGIENTPSYFIYGRVVNPDGTTGELDPNFSNEGRIYQHGELAQIAKLVVQVGVNTLDKKRALQRLQALAARNTSMAAQMSAQRSMAYA